MALGLADEGVAAAFTPAESGGQVPGFSRMPTNPAAQGLAERAEILDGAQACLQPAKQIQFPGRRRILRTGLESIAQAFQGDAPVMPRRGNGGIQSGLTAAGLGAEVLELTLLTGLEVEFGG